MNKDITEQLKEVERTLNSQDTQWAAVRETLSELEDAPLELADNWMAEFDDATDTRGLSRVVIPAGAMRA